MLDRYFFGPFDDRRVEELRAEIARQMADPVFWGGTVGSYLRNKQVGSGLAWREELSYQPPRFPRAIDLSVWIVWNLHVKPRNYCPAAFVGEWEQLTPVTGDPSARWSLSADGDLQTTDPGLRDRDTWAFHRHDKDRPLDGVLLAKGKLSGDEDLLVRCITDHDLTFCRIGYLYTEYHLRRITEPR